MIFDYIRLTGMGGSLSAMDLISRVLFLVIAGLILTLVGFKVKRGLGAAVALAAGVLLFLYNEGMFRF